MNGLGVLNICALSRRRSHAGQAVVMFVYLSIPPHHYVDGDYQVRMSTNTIANSKLRVA